jgi:hypothetical protein
LKFCSPQTMISYSEVSKGEAIKKVCWLWYLSLNILRV